MSFERFYFAIRCLVPRPVRRALRRGLVKAQRKASAGVWPIDPDAKGPPPDWGGWPDGKQFAFVLSHDVEGALGVERCRMIMDLERKQGFRSAFYFVAGTYHTPASLRAELDAEGFEVGVHGLHHDGKLYLSHEEFLRRTERINHCLEEWGAVGFRSPFMQRNLEWMHALNIEYDASTFDTDPFEPQSDGAGTIFPFIVTQRGTGKNYVELPYTLPQDSTLFLYLQEQNIDIWKEKLDWIAERGGLAFVTIHPDYVTREGEPCEPDEFPFEFYEAFLDYVSVRYTGQYWHALPRDLARFWRSQTEDSAQG